VKARPQMSAPFVTAAALLIVLGALSACSDVREVVALEEAGESPGSVGFGEGTGTTEVEEESKVCADGIPCAGGVCLPSADGTEVCAKGCSSSCPPGSICKLIAQDGEFPKPYCVDIQALLCNPCLTDSECNLSVDLHFNRCVKHGTSGSYCAANCGVTGASCPGGYACQEVEGTDGVVTEQCLPIAGQCTCSPLAANLGLSTSCAVENEFGSCKGARECTTQGLTHCQSSIPVGESCNALDDDCDGYVDEGVTSPCGGCATDCDLDFEPKAAVGMGVSQNPYGGALSDIVSNDLPIIWIANSAESTVSRLNTGTGCEEARFHTCGDPSRTAVDQDASGFIGCRNGGHLMKIATQENLCVDVNGNGTIETSRDLDGSCTITPDEMVQGDECILWQVAPPGAVALRGAGVDKDGNVWVGEYNLPALFLIDGTTGDVLKQHNITSQPYGLAIDADGIVWVASRSPNGLSRIDPETGQTGQWPVPTGDAYGIAIDPYGKVWVANYNGGGVHCFDPTTNTWTHLAGTGTSGRGVAVRLVYGQNLQVLAAKVYIANSSQGVVDIYDAGTVTHEGAINLGSNLSAVGVALDLEGFLWVVNQSGNSAHKVDTTTNTIVGTYPVGSGPYTYSDMTGYAFHTITSVQGVHRKVFEGWEGHETSWDHLTVEAELPGGEGMSHIRVGYRAGNTVDELKAATWIEPDVTFPPSLFPHPVGLQGSLLEVKVHLITLDETAKPKLTKVSVQAHKI
jgi:hypothetical protein